MIIMQKKILDTWGSYSFDSDTFIKPITHYFH